MKKRIVLNKIYVYCVVLSFSNLLLLQKGWMKAGSMQIVQLPHSPRTSRQPSMGSDLNKSIRSLMSFRDVFVDRKRIQFGCKITEGEKSQM